MYMLYTIYSISIYYFSPLATSPAAERGQDRVPVVQLSSAYASTTGFASHLRATPVVPISTTPASDGQIFTDFGGREDAGTRVRQQPS